jgi:hypothetical protein
VDLNPIVYTEKVVRSLLRYKLTAYPFADPGLLAQMRSRLSFDETCTVRSPPPLFLPLPSTAAFCP